MPAAARQGDPGIPHCSPYVIATGSTDVKINGRGAARVGDVSAPHLIPAGKFCVTHIAPIVTGSTSVFINGRPAAYVGSKLATCTLVALGSFDVIVGA
jgi:uncharacterized Zn-binding protein involved in type VI secretion